MYFLALKTVTNLTVETSSNYVVILWEHSVEQKPCVANYHVSWTSAHGPTKEIKTESKYYLMTSFEPCVVYHGTVSAVDLADEKGTPVSFNFTADSGSTYRRMLSSRYFNNNYLKTRGYK